MNTRNTKQKTQIKNYLLSRTDHPTAEMVYTALKTDMPKISLGTVYRNLNAMAQSGEILRVRVDDGVDHFDALTHNHYHFVCKSCGSVSDLFEVEDNISIGGDFKGKLLGHSTFFYGQCETCINSGNH